MIQEGSTVDQITASMTTHAMNDAVPLRFGIIPPRYVVLQDIQVDEFSTNNQKPTDEGPSLKAFIYR